MMDGPCCYVIVPLYNEAANLERLVASFRSLEVDLKSRGVTRYIVVDDGSSDGTADIAERLTAGLELRVIRQEKNLGPGLAFATAFQSLADSLRDEDWVVTMEGDNTSRVELVRQMFRRSEEGYDAILASPYMYGGGIVNTTTFRGLLSYGANVFIREVLGIQGILTMSSFFRLYRGSLIRRLQEYYGPSIIERAGFESMIEMLMKMVYLRTPISEIAMVLDTSLRAGKSKMNIRRTILNYLGLVRQKNRWKAIAAGGS
jgi:dolichol-phosphate mannosyltransferase